MVKIETEVDLLIDGAWVSAIDNGNGVRQANPISVKTGRSNWSSRTDTGMASWTMDNRDGRWSPDYAGGAYSGLFKRNIPCRIGRRFGDPYLGYTEQSATLATTPNIGGGGGGSPSTPSVVSVTESAETSFVNTHNITMPTVTVGDRLVLLATGGHQSYQPSGSDFNGWTQVRARNLHTFHRWVVYEIRIEDSADVTAISGQTLNFATTESVKSSAQVIRVSGARAGAEGTGFACTADVDVASGFGNGPDSPSLTVPWGASANLFFSLFTSGGTGANVSSSPSGFTAGADGNIGAGVVVGSSYLADSGATVDPGAYLIDDNENWEALTFAYQPEQVAGSAGSLDVTGDLELRIEFQFHVDPFTIPFDFGIDRRVLLAHRTEGASGWYWELFNYNGDLHTSVVWYDSSNVFHRYETFGIERLPVEIISDRMALRFTLDVDNGSSESVGRFYYSDSIDGTWTEVGDGDTGEGVTDIEVNNADLRVGGFEPLVASHAPLEGKIFAFRLYDGIGGTVVANPDFSAQIVGASSFDDSTGATWTIESGGVITNTRWRFHGELASIPTRWNTKGNDVWAPVEASGIFRRLRQGNRALQSAYRRAVLFEGDNVAEYWPMEEEGDSLVRLGNLKTVHQFRLVSGKPEMANNGDFVCSSPLMTVKDSRWHSQVNPNDQGSWAARFLLSVPNDWSPSGSLTLIHFPTGPSPDLEYRIILAAGGNLSCNTYSGGVLQTTGSALATLTLGVPCRVSLLIEQAGSGVSVQIFVDNVDSTPSGGSGETFSNSNAQFPTFVRINDEVNVDYENLSIGHLTIETSTTLTIPGDSLDGHNGETAVNRIQRLCREEGVPSRIQGFPDASEEMGPQLPATLMTLLEECADTDLGVLYEPRETRAVGYRIYDDMSNQSTKVALDYSAGEVAQPLDLDRDDQDFANDVTVENSTGTIARAVLDDGSDLSVSEPPVGSGRYDRNFRVNGQDIRLPILAERRLKLSSPDEPRISNLQLALHHAALVSNTNLTNDILEAELGDLIAVDNNLPVALGTITIRQILQGTSERIGQYEHIIDCLTSPAAPFLQAAQAVTDLDAVGGDSSVLLTWSEPFNDGSDITEYDIQRSSAGASTGFADLVTISPATSYVDNTAVNEVQYWYRVRAVNSAGDAEWSNVATATPAAPGDVPAAINDLTATTASSSQIDLAWSAPTSTAAITSYDIQRSATSNTGPWSDVEIDLSPTISYSDIGLTADTTYWYRVRATSSEGDGPWSNIDFDTTSAAAASSPSIQTGHLGTGFASATTSWVVNLPSTVDSGDELVVVLTITSAAIRTITPPTGWTSQQKDTQGSNLTTEWFTKDTVDGSEDSGTATFTIDASVTGAAYSFAVSGHDGNGPIFATAVGNAGTANPDPPANTHGLGSVPILAVAFFGARDDDATVSTYPSGYTYVTAQQQGGGGTNNSAELGIAALQTTASSVDPGTFTLSESENWVAQTVVFGPAAGGGGGGNPGTAAPTIPTFSSTLTITAGQNVKSLVEAQPAGTHITLAAGTHTNCENVKLKSNQHIRLATGCILEGSGKGYCFRPLDQSVTGVAIGGDPAGARPIIRNYGLGTTSQGFGAIMGRVDDALNLYGTEPNFVYQDTDNWFIYHLDLEENSSNGIKMGSNWTIYDVESHGHTVTGFQGDRTVGGLVHSCLLYWNALSPATGVGSNGANIKMTWTNADEGRTAVTPIDRTKADFVVSNTTFEALDRNGGPGDTNIGMWFDLDCKQCLVEYCSFDDHPSVAVFFEGCNDGEVAFCEVRNSDGYGVAFGDDFINGGICFGESTNCNAHDNTIIDCTRGFVIRQSNRSSDWYNSNNGSFVNYAWEAGPRYWIDANGRGSSILTTDRSNMWTSGHTVQNNTFINCSQFIINEGSDAGGMDCSGSIPNDLTIAGNDYSASSMTFYNKSNTGLSLAQWQALGYDV